MGKFIDDANELLKQIGGKENIAAVSHCMTRMRFVLNDPKKADINAIENIKAVKGSFTQAGQFQVIIGNEVPDFYNDFVSVSGIEGVSKEAVKQASKQNQNALQKIVSVFSEIFAPLIPALIVGGLILGFRNVIDSIAMFENGTKTLVEISQFWAGVDHFLWLIGEAIFHMLPVGICWSITKKMGTTQMLGIVLGLTLVSGQLLNAYGVAGAEVIPAWNFGFFKINMIGYQAQIVPAMLAGFALVYIEKFFRKITPQVVSMIVVPFMSIIISVTLAHFVLGPIGWKLGDIVSAVVYAGITGPFKVIFAGIFGFVYAPLVITGLHHMTNAIDLQLISNFDGTMLWPMIALSNIAQGSAVLGMIILQRKNTRAQEINVPACISCYLGVTEPAIFGVNLKNSFPFLSAMIGSALAAIVSVSFSVTANSIGVGGLPGILSIKTSSMLMFALCMLIAIVVPALLTILIGTKKLGKDNKTSVKEKISIPKEVDKKDEFKLSAYVKGEVIDLKDVNDGVFSSGVLGKGLAIKPTDEGIVYAPTDATVMGLIMDSKHALGLVLDNGMEILLHIGVDTVNMKGDGFSYFVSEGDKVKKGDKLIAFDKNKIKAAGYKDEVIMIISNMADKSDIEISLGKKVDNIDDIIVKFI